MGGSWDATNVADGQVAVVTPDRDRPRAVPRQHGRGHRHREERHHQGRRGRRHRAAGAGRRRDPARARPGGRGHARLRGQRLRHPHPRGRGRRPAALGARARRGLRRPVPAAARPAPGPQRGRRPRGGRGLRRRRPAAAGRSTSCGPGWRGATSPGRLEVVRRSPTVLVDAAHNPAGAQALEAAMEDSFNFARVIGVVAVLEDKDADLDAGDPRAGPGRGRRHPHDVAARDEPDPAWASSRPRSTARTA